jgi:hypothetical protein
MGISVVFGQEARDQETPNRTRIDLKIMSGLKVALLGFLFVVHASSAATTVDVTGTTPNGYNSGKFNIFTGSSLVTTFSISSISGDDTYRLTQWTSKVSVFSGAVKPMVITLDHPGGSVTRTLQPGADGLSSGASTQVFTYTWDSGNTVDLTVGSYSLTFTSDAAISQDGWVVQEVNGVSFETADGTVINAITSSLGTQTTVVPEPHEYAIFAGLGLIAFGIYRKHSQAATI